MRSASSHVVWPRVMSLVPGPRAPTHEAGALGRRGSVGGAAGDAGGGQGDVAHELGRVVLGHDDARAPEGVGLHHVAAGGEVAGVDRLDDLWAGEDEDFVAPVERLAPAFPAASRTRGGRCGSSRRVKSASVRSAA